MDAQWYIFNKLQVEGPFSWEELNKRAGANTIDTDDLIWNNNAREWIEAANILDFNHQEKPILSNYPATSKAKKSLFCNLFYKPIALIVTAIFLFLLSSISLYLHFSGGNKETVSELDRSVSYNIISGIDKKHKQDSTQNDIRSAEGKPGKEHQINEDNSFAGTGSEGLLAYYTDQATENTAENVTNIEAGSSDSPREMQKAISFQGGKYVGPLLNEQPHGMGMWNHPDGRSYAGDFQHGEITGFGAMTFAGGEKYVGTFYQAKAHGSGTLVHTSGRAYSGEFSYGIIEGYGTMTFPGGEQYTGYFKNGVGHGKGTMTHPDGEFVSGTWINGKLTEKD